MTLKTIGTDKVARKKLGLVFTAMQIDNHMRCYPAFHVHH